MQNLTELIEEILYILPDNRLPWNAQSKDIIVRFDSAPNFGDEGF